VGYFISILLWPKVLPKFARDFLCLNEAAYVRHKEHLKPPPHFHLPVLEHLFYANLPKRRWSNNERPHNILIATKLHSGHALE
jgi:hypothetical protein